MSASPLDDYVAGVAPEAAPLVRSLDAAVRAAHADFDVAVKYHILMYTLGADWRTWVCAIQATKKTVCLRFLYGVLLDDPLEVLRAGSSVLMTWDYPFGAEVDPAAVGAYVSEAVDRYDGYRADSARILEATRAGRRAGPRTAG